MPPRFKGAVVVVTHHQKFMEGLLTEKWHVADGGVTFRKDGEEPKAEKEKPAPKAKAGAKSKASAPPAVPKSGYPSKK